MLVYCKKLILDVAHGSLNIFIMQRVIPNPRQHCGPYQPQEMDASDDTTNFWNTLSIDSNPGLDMDNHDTIEMIAIDQSGNGSAGTSTNGLTFLHTRVNVQPIFVLKFKGAVD